MPCSICTVHNLCQELDILIATFSREIQSSCFETHMSSGPTLVVLSWGCLSTHSLNFMLGVASTQQVLSITSLTY